MPMLDVLRRRRRSTAAPERPFFHRLVGLLTEQGVGLVLDIGANEGQFATALFAAGFAGRVVSVEPHPETHGRLVARARRRAGWTVQPPIALGEEEGTAELFSFDRSDMNSLLAPAEAMDAAFQRLGAPAPVSVPVRRLDRLWPDLVGDGDRVMLKLDTQGSEAAVLAGAGDRLADVAVVQCEAAVTPLYQGQPRLAETIAAMAGLGFEPALLSAGHWSRRLGRQLDLDVVFVPRDPDPKGMKA